MLKTKLESKLEHKIAMNKQYEKRSETNSPHAVVKNNYFEYFDKFGNVQNVIFIVKIADNKQLKKMKRTLSEPEGGNNRF